jgi:hypothetical protein
MGKGWVAGWQEPQIAVTCAPPGTRAPNPLIPMRCLLSMLVHYGICVVTWAYARLGIEVRCRRTAACRTERCGINRGIVPSGRSQGLPASERVGRLLELFASYRLAVVGELTGLDEFHACCVSWLSAAS